MKITELRGTKREIDRKMRRARNLYVRFCRGAIACDKTTVTLQHVADRMVECGMYSCSTGGRSVRYAILRRMWKFDAYRGLEWWAWHKGNGWQPYTWTRAHLRAIQA